MYKDFAPYPKLKNGRTFRYARFVYAFFTVSAATGAIEDCEKQDDYDYPHEGIVFENVTEASHDINLRNFHFV